MERKLNGVLDNELVLNATEEEATGDLSDASKFAIAQLQSCAQMARDIAGATVFLTVVLPVADNSARARMLCFNIGCNCPMCAERADAISAKTLEVTRDVSAMFAERVAMAHSEPPTDTHQ